jgi:hypothetical protein
MGRRVVAAVAVVGVVAPLVVVSPKHPAPTTIPRHALSASSVSRLAIQPRLAGTNMNKMPPLISAMQPLLLPPAVTTSGTLTPVPLII